MASELWLLRHGEAEPHGSRPDPERDLTDRGERQSRRAGVALAALGLEFGTVLSSPKVRAMRTAELACEALGREPAPHRPLATAFDADEARSILAGHGEDDLVLVVGHEPDFSQVVLDLTGARVDFKKGGVAGIRLDGARGELVALLRPREIRRIAGVPD